MINSRIEVDLLEAMHMLDVPEEVRGTSGCALGTSSASLWVVCPDDIAKPFALLGMYVGSAQVLEMPPALQGSRRPHHKAWYRTCLTDLTLVF
jgi:hypothetical protein